LLAHPHLHHLLHLRPFVGIVAMLGVWGFILWNCFGERLRHSWHKAGEFAAVQMEHQQLKQCPYCGATRGITSMLPPWDDTSQCSECKQEWAW
jgi:hypothetical protein